MTDQPIPGTGGFGFMVDEDAEDPNPRRQSIDELFRHETYVVVPPEYLPRTFVDRVCDLAVKFAADLKVKTPQVRFFAPVLTFPAAWAAFKSEPIYGRVAVSDLGRIWLHVGGPHLEDTIAHEVAHTAGHDEEGARAYAARATQEQENEDA